MLPARQVCLHVLGSAEDGDSAGSGILCVDVSEHLHSRREGVAQAENAHRLVACTVRARREPPLVFLTSNNTREISDALKRRCLHLYIPFPDIELEQRIINARVPAIPPQLRTQLVRFIHGLRELDLKKVPSISETIDWARTLLLLHADRLDPELVSNTMNVILKFQEDIENVQPEVRTLTQKATAG